MIWFSLFISLILFYVMRFYFIYDDIYYVTEIHVNFIKITGLCQNDIGVISCLDNRDQNLKVGDLILRLDEGYRVL